jgi:hypothetical protein
VSEKDFTPNPHRQQQLYWSNMVALGVATDYARRCRNHWGRWVARTGTVRAIASCGSIAAWAVWKQHVIIWAAIIALAQVIDALKEVFPITKNHRAASEYVNQLESLFIDAQLEWESVFDGRYTDDEINSRKGKLMKLRQEAEKKRFPDGLPDRPTDLQAAKTATAVYFKETYNVEG